MLPGTPWITRRLDRVSNAVQCWLGIRHDNAQAVHENADHVDWIRAIPFILLHVACFGAIWTGISTTAVLVAVGLYLVRIFAITAFYHRYFSHRTFKTSRWFQFMMAMVGASAAQRGPLWWAAHHRHHHNESDTEHDLHSPRQKGFILSHCGWFLTCRGFKAPSQLTRDWNRFPELVWIDKYCLIPPLLLAGLMFGLGALLQYAAPGLNTGPWQMLVWGFCISTVFTYHATYTINSLAHKIGSQRFKTGDDSRNNFFLALLTLGEGWHNNHHHYPASVRQGFYWYEIDMTWYVLLLFRSVGLVSDLRPVPRKVLEQAKPEPVVTDS